MMEREVGNLDFPLWLIGDSNPSQWEATLKTPLDPRHPVRHNIWTSILDVIQDSVYRQARLRLDTSCIYIRNALDRASRKPKETEIQWSTSVVSEVSALGNLLQVHRPTIVFSFGQFAFEFVRRAMGEKSQKSVAWGAKALGHEFRERMQNFDPAAINAIPLLHVSISWGKFIESHEYFCDLKGANYFEVVGTAVAGKLLENRSKLRIWID